MCRPTGEATRFVGARGGGVLATVTAALPVTPPSDAVTVPVANWPCGELEETETVTSPACGGDTSTCMAAEGWPAVSACAPEPNERAAGGGAPEAGVTANSHVRQDVVESVPFARLYWLP